MHFIPYQLHYPQQNQSISKWLIVQGWISSQSVPIEKITLHFAETLISYLKYEMMLDGTNRYRFGERFSLEDVPNGSLTLQIVIHYEDNEQFVIHRRVHVQEVVINSFIDTPINQQAIDTSHVFIRGWAFSEVAAITKISVYMGDTLLGTLPYGFFRPDVGDFFDNPLLNMSGFEGNLQLPPATSEPQSLSLSLRIQDNQANVARQIINIVRHAPAKTPPIPLFDFLNSFVGQDTLSPIAQQNTSNQAQIYLERPWENYETLHQLEVRGWVYSIEQIRHVRGMG